jgi:hypothetical protein
MTTSVSSYYIFTNGYVEVRFKVMQNRPMTSWQPATNISDSEGVGVPSRASHGLIQGVTVQGEGSASMALFDVDAGICAVI